MAWESRASGKYYYRSIRTPDGRVVKSYFGNGLAAGMAAELDAEARARRRAEAEAVAAERARLAPLDEAMAALDRACHLAVEATLVAAGYHRRGTTSAWRRRRAVLHGRVGGGGEGRRG